MPHTLAHIGAQTFGTRALVRPSDGVWILAACAVPDLPWVLQRVVQASGIGDPYALRLYATAQATLLCSLVLCAGIASLARDARRAFAVLALGALLHLLLDATQHKFGNGVHLLAPLSWDLLHLDLYPPESVVTLALTVLGAVAVFRLWREPVARPFRWTRRRVLLAGAWTLAWLLLPLALAGGPERSDAHSTRTLRDVPQRPGREVFFDRSRYILGPEGHVLRTWAGEEVRLVGPATAALGERGLVSVHGRFVDAHTLSPLALREHPAGVRDAASALGLLVIAAYWIRALRADPPWGPTAARAGESKRVERGGGAASHG